jgi:hypothetical protein
MPASATPLSVTLERGTAAILAKLVEGNEQEINRCQMPTRFGLF